MLVYQRVIRHRRSGSKNLEMVTLLIRTHTASRIFSTQTARWLNKNWSQHIPKLRLCWLDSSFLVGSQLSSKMTRWLAWFQVGFFSVVCLMIPEETKHVFCFPKVTKHGTLMWVKQCHKPSPSHHHQYIGGIYIIYICTIPSHGWFMALFYPH
jgi:hypothetical protein